MTVNLFGRSSSYERSLARSRRRSAREAVWAFRPTREGNTVVLALREPQQPAPRRTGRAGRTSIATRWGLPAHKWLRVFKPVE
jgi:spermidine synthase